MKKIISIMLVVLVCLSLLGSFVNAAGNASDADEPGAKRDVLTEEEYNRMYNPANYEHEYALGEVRVKLQSFVTRTSNYEELFPELDIDYVRTQLVRYYLSGLMKGQTITIVLKEKTRESVIDAIELLKNNEYVYYSQPNYIGYGCEGDGTMTPTLILGDVNYDGRVTNEDLLLVARHVVEIIVLEDSQLKAADTNGDGVVDNSDLIYVAKKVVGIV